MNNGRITFTTFTKVMILLLAVIAPLFLIYTYSNFTNRQVIRQALTDSKLQTLTMFMNQVENNANQLKTAGLALLEDPDVRKVNYLNLLSSDFEIVQAGNQIKDKLALNSATTNWSNQLTVYSTQSQEAVSSEELFPFPLPEEMAHEGSEGPMWHFTEGTSLAQPAYFTGYVSSPLDATTMTKGLYVQIRVPVRNLIDMLDQYKLGPDEDAFLIDPLGSQIAMATADQQRISQWVNVLKGQSLSNQGVLQLSLDGRDFLVPYVKSKVLGLYFVDAVPLQQMFTPIERNQRLFSIAVVVLILLGLLASYVLYQQIQVPVSELMKQMRAIKRGTYNSRIRTLPNNEFRILYTQFNEMAEQIQTLIERVLAEQIQVREATLKQLQSQINPHFLYNCLFFIKNMAKVNNTAAVEAMALSLGEYFRYTTRVDRPLVPLQEEIQTVRHYLNIQGMRMSRLHFDIEIPADMNLLEIPRLCMQPLVENAIKHGLETKAKSGRITIRGFTEGGFHHLTVEDDGGGLDAAALDSLNRQFHSAASPEQGYGLWNVNQRMMHYFGSESGILLLSSPLGGIMADLKWNAKTA